MRRQALLLPSVLPAVMLLAGGCPTPKLSVPDVVGLTRTAAENAILSANLTLGTISEDFHDTVPSGSVASQEPAADTMVSPGSAVNLVVSKGAVHASYDESVKILTFNVRMIPETWDDFCCDISNGDRAKLIGDLLRATDFDIIALNEVFDEDSKAAFVARLGGVFPHYVRKIDKESYIEDSGLMLFSRFPFEPLPNPDWMFSFPMLATPLIEAVSGGNSAWEKVAALVYPDSSCSDFDCQSAKAVGLVRVKNPETGHVMNIAFSHTQASYGDGDCKAEVDGRSAQFSYMEQLIRTVLGNFVDSQPVFLLGDLNVNGDQKYYPAGYDWGYEYGGPCDSNNPWEWGTRFSSPGVFTTDVLWDSWVYEMQGPNFYNNAETLDRGLTAGLPVSSERLDYVLWNGASRYQIQHLKREHKLRSAGGSVLSDHIGISADYNVTSPNCSPKDARVPVQDALNSGEIKYPGSMQWFRIDEPGTYLVAVLGDDLAYRVYESKDLTSPAPQYYLEEGPIQVGEFTYTGQKFVVPEAPFYIRVYKTARHLTGTYDLAVHRMTGESKEEAISLLPGADWQEYYWPAMPLNEDDSVWFKVHIDTADKPAPQETEFQVAKYNENWLSLSLLNEAEDTLGKDTEGEPFGTNSWALSVKNNELGKEPAVCYLKVFRAYVWPFTFSIRWDTNLTVLHGLWALPDGVPGAAEEMLVCHEETDGGIDDLDETYITIIADDREICYDRWTMQFDDDYNYGLENVLGTIRFTDYVEITLREDDDTGYGADDWFQYWIYPLPYWQREAMSQCQTDTDEDEAGSYSVLYNLSRTLQQKQ